MATQAVISLVAGLVLLALIAIIYGLLTHGRFAQLVEGQDGRASTSKFQLVVWTVVALYAFGTVFVARFLQGTSTIIDTVPPNLLAAMGLSVVTATAAKGITSAQVGSGQVSKSQVGTVGRDDPGAAALVQDDGGAPDLSKTQFLAWTGLAVVIYLFRLVQQINIGPVIQNASIGMPDIDAVLVPLIGLGHAAYLGKKLTTSTVPQITGTAPAEGTPPKTLTLTGSGFGDPQGTSQILIEQTPYQLVVSKWSDSTIVFEFPSARTDGSPWRPGEVVRLAVVVNGQTSGNDAPFTIAIPRLSGLSPLSGKPPLNLTLSGANFGNSQNGSSVLIDGKVYPAVISANDWSDSKITFNLGDTQPGSNQPWSTSTPIQVGLQVNGRDVSVSYPFVVTP
jgi:hypothetical protein